MFITKISKFLTYLILINLSNVLHSMENTTELFQLQVILNSLANKTAISSVGLIGERLVGKKFNDIFSEEQLRMVTPRIIEDDLVLYKYDRNKKIYQLKPLQQYATSCGAHAFKNCLWMINGLSGDFNQFIQSYLKILDQNVFDAYSRSISCRNDRFITFYPQINDIREGKISCISGNECLPENSLDYLDQVFCFTYAPTARAPEPDLPEHVGVAWSRFFNFAKSKLKEIEPGADINKISKDVSIFSSFENKDIMKFYNQVIKTDYCLAIDLDVDNGSMGHATCFIVHKFQNKLEYLFLDSLNLPFDGGYPYMPLIESVKSFVENPESFKEALIRKAYVNVLMYLEYGPLRVFQIHLDVFIDDKFKDLNLMESELYKIYKPHFCKLIKDSVDQDPEDKSKYEEILEKMHCDF